MSKYKFYVPYEDARRVDIPKDVAVEPFPNSLKELVEATKDFYSLWYGLDWDRREVVRIGRIPYESSYEYGREEKDMEVWLVVGSPTRGLIFVEVNPKTGNFMQWSDFTQPCYVFDFIDMRACWFLLWKKEALESMIALWGIRTPRYKLRRKKKEVIYVESRDGIKHRVEIFRKTRHRISFSFDFEGEEGLYRLSKKGIEELEKLAKWIFKEIEKRHGNNWLPFTEVGCGNYFYVKGLPKDLFDEVLEKLRDIARRELQSTLHR